LETQKLSAVDLPARRRHESRSAAIRGRGIR
jgi:hypothetical protein